MYEKFMELKENKKWLFYLLIPIFLVVAGLQFYNTYLINSGKKAVKDAEKEDEKLKEKQNKAEAVADHHKDNADKIEKEIKDTKVDKDWHLK
jgi:anionic cell wall polymer biosynthesis LytR-Cps2A-Psr (LCP) family protein